MCPVRPTGYPVAMPILNSIRNFLSSPQGRRVTDAGRRAAADPRNRDRARGMFSRLRRR